MISIPRQMLVLTRASLASLPRRTAISLSMVLSVALVVAVLIGFLSMAAGLRQTLGAGGSPDVAIVLGGGTQEVGSSIPPEAARSLAASGASGGIASDPARRLFLSREILVPVEATDVDGTSRMIALRGMETAGPALRASASIREGRIFVPGSREIVVGIRLAHDLGGLAPGQVLRLGPVDWTVIGILSAGGGMAESEIWADLDAVARPSTVWGNPDAARPARRAGRPRRASSFLADDLDDTADRRLRSRVPGGTVGTHGAPRHPLRLADRAPHGDRRDGGRPQHDDELGLRPLRPRSRRSASSASAGWRPSPRPSRKRRCSRSPEGVLGAFASWAILDGWQASTLGANDTQLAFRLSVTPLAMLQAGTLALLVGCLGGALPAFAATRLPLVSALRGNG